MKRKLNTLGDVRYIAVLCSLLTVSLTAAAQQQEPAAPPQPTQQQTADPPPPQQQAVPRAPDVSSPYTLEPFHPQVLARPALSTVPPTVNTTGGLINSHPADVFNRQDVYQPPPPEPDTVYAEPALVIGPPPDLSTLNTNAASVQYTDRRQGPFNLGIETDGVLTSNLLNNYTSKNLKGGEFFDISVPVGIQLKGPVTSYGAYLRPTRTIYPAYPNLNHTSVIFSQTLQHRSSDLTTWDWSAGGGRLLGLGSYLPSVISVGSTGIGQSAFSSGLQPMYNAATTLAVTHRLSDLNSVQVSGTGGWMQQPLGFDNVNNRSILSRQAAGALDVAYQHAVSATRALGLEANEVYVKGLSPVGNSNFLSLKATYSQVLIEHGTLRLGAGPLYSRSVSSRFPRNNSFSYSANASFEYQTSFARFTAGYSRIYQLGYLAPASAAHSFYGLVDRPISRLLDLTVDFRFVDVLAPRSSSQAAYTNLGSTARLSYYLTPGMTAFISGATFRQGGLGQNLAANNLTVGLNYTFGNPLSRSGDR